MNRNHYCMVYDCSALCGTKPLLSYLFIVLMHLSMTIIRLFFVLLLLSIVFFQVHGQQASLEWAALIGTSSTEFCHGAATDRDGNVYMVGETSGTLLDQPPAGSNDMYIVKYFANSTRSWVQVIGTSGVDAAYSISYDKTDDVIYLTGVTNGVLGSSNIGSFDIVIIKFTTGGTRLWTVQHGTTNNDYSFSVTALSGVIYVTGRLSEPLDGQINYGNNDVVLLKYDSLGTRQWTRIFGGSNSDIGRGVTTDSAGNVYVTGYTSSTGIYGATNAGSSDIFVAKYSSTGTMAWFKMFGSSAEEQSLSIASDLSANVYMTGYTRGTLYDQVSAGNDDIFILKVNTDGDMVWIRQKGSTWYDYSYAIAVNDTDNAVLVTGTVAAVIDGLTPKTSDMFLLRYNKDGDRISTSLFGSSGSADEGRAIALGRDYSLYLAGIATYNFYGIAHQGDRDIAVVKVAFPAPTSPPTALPTFLPTETPTYMPTAMPTYIPTAIPTEVPSYTPTVIPTYFPSAVPTEEPTYVPSAIPTYTPTFVPTVMPTYFPSAVPTEVPTYIPTVVPTYTPTVIPTHVPSAIPTATPTTETPTYSPTLQPTPSPTNASLLFDQSTSSATLSRGAIAGIVIGTVVGSIFLVVLCVLVGTMVLPELMSALQPNDETAKAGLDSGPESGLDETDKAKPSLEVLSSSSVHAEGYTQINNNNDDDVELATCNNDVGDTYVQVPDHQPADDEDADFMMCAEEESNPQQTGEALSGLVSVDVTDVELAL